MSDADVVIVGAGPTGLTLNLKPVQHRITYTMSQLWASYRKGPLGGSGSKPRPGDRIPDRPCTRADGSATRLSAELGGRWVLLHTTTLHPKPSAALDVPGIPLSPLGYDGAELMLVRPDGHLFWRGAVSDVAGLRREVATTLGTGAR